MGNIAFIIVKSIIGKLSDAEQEQLEQWRRSSFRNEKRYQKYMNSEDFISEMQSLYRPGEEKKLYSPLQKKLFPRKFYIKWIMRGAAAAVIGVLCVVGYHFLPTDSPQPESRPIELADVIPGHQQAILYADAPAPDQKEHDPQRSFHIDYPAAPAFRTEESLLTEKLLMPGLKLRDINRVIVPRGGEYQMTLQDQTQIFLNSESGMRLLPDFNNGERQIAFKGEAYFHVARQDSDHPFSILTPMGKVTVLGTSFNLRCYEETNLLQLALDEGKVLFTDEESEKSIEVKPGQLLTYDMRSGEANVCDDDLRLYTSWHKENVYSFKQTPLSTIMSDLSRWYNIPISFASDDLAQKTFTSEVKRYSNFLEIAQIFELTKMVRFTTNRSGIVVEHY